MHPVQLVGPHVHLGLAPLQHLPPRQLDGGFRHLLGVELGALQFRVLAVAVVGAEGKEESQSQDTHTHMMENFEGVYKFKKEGKRR